MYSLFLIELKRTLALTKRYPANFVSSLLISTLMFYGLFMGAQYLSGQAAFGTNLDAMVVGWTAWVLATKALNKPPLGIQNEADTGVLESVFLSQYSAWSIFLARALSETLVDIVLIVVMIALLVWLTDSQVNFSPAIILPTFTLVLAALGMGMAAGGVALQVKRISAVLPTLQMLLLLLMFTPFENWTTGIEAGLAAIAMWLPMVPSVTMLRGIMAFNTPFDPTLAIKAVINGVGWATFGLMVFGQMAQRVKSKGLLAGY
jgi:ABC-2 type transport system permease protein